MELLILLLIAVAVMAIIISGAYFTCQRVQNYCALQAKRKELVARLRNSRLGRMLHSLNISLRDYLEKFPASAITSQMSNCQNCDASAACDSYLDDDMRDPARAREFCPNMNEFDRLKAEPHKNTT
jgi:Family of unknown function (DUF6455)